MTFVRALIAAAVLIGLTLVTASTHAQGPAARDTASCAVTVLAAGGSPARLVSATNGFGFRLYRALAGGAGGNVFISPASVALALDMAYEGSGSGTQAAMARTLGLQHLSPAAVRQQAAALLAGLQSGDAKAKITIANSLWLRKGVALQPGFAQQVRKDFAARVTHLDFNSPAAPAAINGWVRCATQGTIGSIVSRIPPDLMLYLINAVYFQGEWSAPFNPSHTHVRTFTTGAGTQQQVPLMDQTGTFPYYQGPGFQAISLPYGTRRFDMVVLLPQRDVSLATFGRRLTAANWGTWMSHLHPSLGEIALPRFSLTNTFRLDSALMQLGMRRAFSSQADFAGMCRQRCRISQVRHKTFLKVYEKGTIASAVTSVGISPVAVAQPRYQMIVDHPFYLAIRDGKTGAVLFLGGVSNPTAG